MFQWRAHVLWPINRMTFSPDSRKYVIRGTMGSYEYYWWEEYSAETGTKVNEAFGTLESLKIMQVDCQWPQSRDYQVGLVILDGSNDIFYGEERVCSIPSTVEWGEWARIGDTYFVMMSPTHGVIIMKAPQDVDRS